MAFFGSDRFDSAVVKTILPSRRMVALIIQISLFMNVAAITSFLIWARAPMMVSEGDEQFYAPLSVAMARHGLTAFIRSAWDPSAVDANVYSFGFPHALLLFLLGCIENQLPFDLPVFALVLDILFVFLALLSFFILFRAINGPVNKPLIELAAATIAVGLPWAFSLQNLLLTPTFSLGSLTFVQFRPDFHGGIPSQRYGSTQVAIPFLNFYLAALVRTFARIDRCRFRYFLFGCAAGLSLYIYFFAWLAAVGWGVIVIAAVALSQNSPVKLLYQPAIAFIIGVGFGSVPGCMQIALQRTVIPAGIVPRELLTNVYGYSVEYLFALAAFILLLRRCSATTQRFQLLLIIGLIISNFVIYWLQAWLVNIIGPSNYTLFFSSPLLGGLVVLFLFSRLRSSVAAPAAIVVLSISLAAIGLREYQDFCDIGSKSQEGQELVSFARTLPPGTTIAGLPYLKPFQADIGGFLSMDATPVLVTYLSGTKMFPENPWNYLVSEDEVSNKLKEEKLLGWIFTGEQKLVGPCEITPPSGIGDFPGGVHQYSRFARYHYCERARSVQGFSDPCSALRRYGVTHVLTDQHQSAAVNTSVNIRNRLIWSSSADRFRIYRVQLCGAKASESERDFRDPT